jgi:PadR family transcriptional regulator PadR
MSRQPARGRTFPYTQTSKVQDALMPKPDPTVKTLDFLVLTILSRRAALHGYALMTAIHDISREVLRVEEGSLYPALHRMEEAGWVKAEWTVNENGRRGRVYELTAGGRRQLSAEEVQWERISTAVNRVLRMA